MYVDTIVLAGIGTVALMIGFFGGVVYFLRKDAIKNSDSK